MTANWQTRTIAEIEKILKTNSAAGLSRRSARFRLQADGENEIYELPAARSGVRQTINTADKSISAPDIPAPDISGIVLVLAAGASAFFGNYAESAVIIALIVINYFLIFLANLKSRRVALSLIASGFPEVRVIREGVIEIAGIREIVRGDLILLERGDVVPCDARLVRSEGLGVIEHEAGGIALKNADVTYTSAESRPRRCENMVYAASVVISGSAAAIAVDTGGDTFIRAGRPCLPLLPESKSNPVAADPETASRKFGRVWGIITLMAAVLIISTGALGRSGGGLYEALFAGLAFAASSMFDYILPINKIINACSITGAMFARGKRNRGECSVIKNPGKLGALAAADTLVMMGGGAFFTGKSISEGIFLPDERILLGKCILSGSRTDANGSSPNVNRPVSRGETLLCAALLTNVIKGSDAAAFAELLSGAGADDRVISDYRVADEYTDENSSGGVTTLAYRGTNEYTAFAGGDFREILGLCIHYLTPDNTAGRLDADIRAQILSAGEDCEQRCCTLYGFAFKPTAYNNLQKPSAVRSGMIWAGFLAFRTELAPGLHEVIKECTENEIKPVWIHTGNIKTGAAAYSGGRSLRAAAKMCGFSEKSIVSYNDDPNPGAGRSVYIGYPIPQVREIIKEFRKSGGVGVAAGEITDSVCMNAADVSFTYYPIVHGSSPRGKRNEGAGRYGCQMLKKNADVLIKRAGPDGGGLSSALSAVIYARMAARNLRGTAGYLVFSLIMRLILTFASVVFAESVITPVQILFSGLIIDLTAAVILAFEKPSQSRPERYKKQNKHDPRGFDSYHTLLPYTKQAALGAVSGAVILLALYILRNSGLAADHAGAVSFVFTSVVLTQLAVLFSVKGISPAAVNPVGAAGVLLASVFFTVCLTTPQAGALFGIINNAPLFAAAICTAIILSAIAWKVLKK